MLRLISIHPSSDPKKKYTALFIKNNRIKKVNFGASGYPDYIQYQYDPNHAYDKKMEYLKRHRPREYWNIADSPGALSRYILWNKPTLKESIDDYIKRFNL